MEEKILKTIKEYNLIENGDKVIVGVSGGPDSITLLDVLSKIKNKNIIDFEIIVCHINHMIREEAAADEEYVKEYCSKNNIKCFAKRAEVEKLAKQEKCGTEETGRKIRYEFFYEILAKEKANKIILSVHGMSSNCFKEREDKLSSYMNENNIDYFCFNNRGSELVKYIRKDINDKE